MTGVTPSMTAHQIRVSYWVLAIGIIVFVLDQLSKGLVTIYLPAINSSLYWYPYGGIGVFHNFLGIEFSINHMTNTGAAWGVLGNYQLSLNVVRVGLISALFVYLLYFNRRRAWQFPLMLIIAGALGNVFDYFVYGHVVDMFHFIFWGYDFPVFNVADTSITLGIAALFILSWLEAKT
jgi:signal peptidase II